MGWDGMGGGQGVEHSSALSTHETNLQQNIPQTLPVPVTCDHPVVLSCKVLDCEAGVAAII